MSDEWGCGWTSWNAPPVEKPKMSGNELDRLSALERRVDAIAENTESRQEIERLVAEHKRLETEYEAEVQRLTKRCEEARRLFEAVRCKPWNLMQLEGFIQEELRWLEGKP